jgi:hypothetical protein
LLGQERRDHATDATEAQDEDARSLHAAGSVQTRRVVG